MKTKTDNGKKSGDDLIILIIICGFASFLFGWHVHEKAVLMILIPLSYISTRNKDFASLYFMMSLVSGYSLFPLIFRREGILTFSWCNKKFMRLKDYIFLN